MTRSDSFRLIELIAVSVLLSMLSACGGGGGGTSGDGAVTPVCDTTNLATASLSVIVSDPGATGATLNYEWKSSDGCIVNVNAPKTNWTLPAGPGLHFAYVLISNGMGGYTERRIAVNTDNLNIPKVIPTPDATKYSAPVAPAPQGNYFHGGVLSHGTYESIDTAHVHAFMPDVLVYFADTDPANPRMFPAGGPLSPVKTDIRGKYVIPGLPAYPLDPIANNYYQGYCSTDKGLTWDKCGAAKTDMPNYATTVYAPNDYSGLPPFNPASQNLLFHFGKVLLEDNSVCGTVNEFFQKEITGTAESLDVDGNVLGGPVRLSSYGDFSLRYSPNTASIRISCEGITPVLIPINISNRRIFGLTKLTGLKAPAVSAMTAEINGVVAATLPIPPANPRPSDLLPNAEQFFSIKGIDTRKGACQYYKAIGAVRDCDATGKFIGAVNFEDWKKAVRISPASGAPEYQANFVNQVDLNLSRNHHSVSYGPNDTAAYVCNHAGPINSTQLEINKAVDNAVNGKNLVACVSMDYRLIPGVNGDRPFTRFLIFGPSGELLPSINLDGRREKFMPGVCTVCHGGDKYAGKFPEDGSGYADIGGHFLPYDIGNFAFSNDPLRTRAAQEEVIYNLNQNVLNTGPTLAAQELIGGWYPNNTHTMNIEYLPPSWQEANLPAKYQGKNMDKLYHSTVSRSCRTCHVNLSENFNYDRFTFDTGLPKFDEYAFISPVCGQRNSATNWSSYSMPGSSVTFDRFWQSAGTGAATDQVAQASAFISILSPSTSVPCSLPVAPIY